MKHIGIVLILFFVGGCSIFKSTPTVSTLNVDTLIYNQVSYNSLSFKFLMKYNTGNQSVNLFGNFDNYYDSIIYIDLSPGFGIKVANILITPDTTIVYLPMQREAYVGGTDLFLNKYNVALNFYSLQAILTANLFSYPYFIDIKDYNVEFDTAYFVSNKIMNPRNSSVTDILHYFRYSSDNNISNLYVADYALNKVINVSYSNFSIFDDIFSLPVNTSVKLIQSDTTSFNIKYKNINYNNSPYIHFNLPSNVQIISL